MGTMTIEDALRQMADEGKDGEAVVKVALLKMAARTIEHLRGGYSMKNWIPTEKALPESEDYVLCCTARKDGRKNVITGYYCADLGRWVCGNNSNVVAWMPLPTPYQEER